MVVEIVSQDDMMLERCCEVVWWFVLVVEGWDYRSPRKEFDLIVVFVMEVSYWPLAY